MKRFEEMTHKELVRYFKMLGIMAVVVFFGSFGVFYAIDEVNRPDSGASSYYIPDLSTQELLERTRALPGVSRRYDHGPGVSNLDRRNAQSVNAHLGYLGRAVWWDSLATQRDRFLPRELAGYRPSAEFLQEIGCLAVVYDTVDLGEIGLDSAVAKAHRAELVECITYLSKAMEGMNVGAGKPKQLLQRLTSGERLYGKE